MQQWSLAAMPGTLCVLVSGCGTFSLPWGPWWWPESYSTDPLKGQSQQKATHHQGSQLPAEPEQGSVWPLGSLSSFICTTRGESPAVWGCSPSLPPSRAEEPTAAAAATARCVPHGQCVTVATACHLPAPGDFQLQHFCRSQVQYGKQDDAF